MKFKTTTTRENNNMETGTVSPGNASTAAVVVAKDHAVLSDWSPAEVKNQLDAISSLMKASMRVDEDFGIILGSKKPSLLKPGAEKLGLMFRLAATYDIQKSTLERAHREYEIVCTLTHIPTGRVLGSGVGSCSSMESKYRWRQASRKCPNCQKEAIIKGKVEFGGGWLCFGKKGGCGAKWPDGAAVIESQEVGRIENEDIADQYNTVLKMAKKRAHIDATLNVTAASQIFTQDIDENPARAGAPEPEDEPRREPEPAPMREDGRRAAPQEDVPPAPSGQEPWEAESLEVVQARSLSANCRTIDALRELKDSYFDRGGKFWTAEIKTIINERYKAITGEYPPTEGK